MRSDRRYRTDSKHGVEAVWKTSLLTIALAAIAAAGCIRFQDADDAAPSPTQASAQPTQPTAASGGDTPLGGTLRRPWADPPTLDPHLVGDTVSAGIVVEVFSGLVKMSTDLQIEPDIAESWEISEDGTVYTFKIRGNARFHDGKTVTAHDFVYSLNRAANPETASPVSDTYLGDIAGMNEVSEGRASKVAGVRAVDDRTLEITIDSPKVYFLSKLTYPTAFVVDENDVERGPAWANHPNGTGPFKLAEYIIGERLVLERNDDFYMEPAKLDRVVMNLTGGQAIAMYENDEIDMMDVSLPDLERLRNPNEPLSKELTVAPPGFRVEYIGFDLEKPPFDDVDFRRAMNMAIDKETITEIVLLGLRTPAYGALPIGFPGHDPDLEGLHFDPEQARRFLEQSKYADPDTRPRIVLTLRSTGGAIGPEFETLIEMWRQNLGVEVEIQQVEWAAYLQDLYSDERKYQSFSIGWTADYPDPQNFLDILFHSASNSNFTGYSNPEFDRLLEQARVEQEERKRINLYRQAERYLVNDAPWLPLWYGRKLDLFGDQFVLLKPYVKGYVPTPMILPKLRHVYIDRAP